MTRCLLALACALPAFAAAAIPVLSTDTLAAGEVLCTLSTSHLEGESGTTLRSPANTWTGNRDYRQATYRLSVDVGASDTLSWFASATLLDGEETTRLYGPSQVQLGSEQRGIDDLGVGAYWRAYASGAWAWTPLVRVNLPTASDSPGQIGSVINGTTNTLVERADAGSGETYARLTLHGSRRGNQSALELSGGVSAGEDDSSRLVKSIAVSAVVMPEGKGTYRVSIYTSHTDSTNSDSNAFQGSTVLTSASLSGEWRFDDTTRVYLSASQGNYDGVSSYYPGNSSTLQYGQGNSTAFGAGISLLFR